MTDYHEIYEKLAIESTRVGWPLHYQNDLHIIDHRFLEMNEPERFVWVLRQNGTHLFDARWIKQGHGEWCRVNQQHDPRSCWGLCEGAIGWLKAVMNIEPDALIYTWQQRGLKKSTLDEAVRYLERHAPRQVAETVGISQYASG